MGRVSCSVLEHSHLDSLKEGVKKLWEYESLTAALLLTIVFAMINAPPDPDDGTHNGLGLSHCSLRFITQIYISVVLLSSYWLLTCIFRCLANLIYVEPLDNNDTIKYIIANPNCLGEPGLDLTIGVICMMLANVMYSLCQYGLPVAVTAAMVTTAFITTQAIYAKGKDTFDPTDSS